MSVSVTVAGVSYTIPSVGDVSWGPQVTAWIQAISSVTLQTSGGNFTLTSDLNFGSSFGLISKYYTSVAANAASAGAIRLANLDFIKWRNAANSADLGLQLDASNIFQFGSAINSSGNITGANLSGTNSGDISIATFGSTPNANGASLAGQALTLQPADGTHPGSVSTAAQTFGGAKTFSSIISAIFQSSTANPAGSGIFRLANADAIAFRNIGNSADILLQPHADGILQYNSIDLVNLSATQNLTNKTLAAASNTISGLTNSNLSGSAGITGGNMAASTVANSNLATMVANTVKANVTGSPANPTDVSLVSAATAAAAMIRDASANVQANNFIENLTSTATAGGTTVLSVSSSAIQQFTGTLNQTVTLPDCTTLLVGFAFYVTNRSTGTVTVNNKGGSAQQTMASNSSAVFTCTSVGSSNGAWDVQYVAASALSNPMTTGGDIIYGGTSGTPARLANGSANQFLMSNGGTAAPSWAFPAINPVSKTTTYTAVANDYIYASGASFTITLPTAVGALGQTIVIEHAGTSLTQIYTLNTTSAQTIGGLASGVVTLTTSGEVFELVSDNANWRIRDHKTATAAVAYTPTLTNFGSSPLPTVIISTWSRNADRIKIQGIVTFSSGAISGIQSVSFPTGVTSDSTKMSTTNYMSIGTAGQSGQNVGILPIAEGNQTTFGFGVASTTQLAPANVAISSTNISWSIEFTVSGWQP